MNRPGVRVVSCGRQTRFHVRAVLVMTCYQSLFSSPSSMEMPSPALLVFNKHRPAGAVHLSVPRPCGRRTGGWVARGHWYVNSSAAGLPRWRGGGGSGGGEAVLFGPDRCEVLLRLSTAAAVTVTSAAVL